MCAASQRSALRADVVVALADAGRDRPLDAAEQRLERVGQLVLGDVELGGDHAAADVDADRRRDHRALGRDHRADGGADADVGVGHEGDVALDDRQAGRLLGLADGLRVDVARPGDELVVDVGGHGSAIRRWCRSGHLALAVPGPSYGLAGTSRTGDPRRRRAARLSDELGPSASTAGSNLQPPAS